MPDLGLQLADRVGCPNCGQPSVLRHGVFCSESCTAIWLKQRGWNVALTPEEVLKQQRLQEVRDANNG